MTSIFNCVRCYQLTSRNNMICNKCDPSPVRSAISSINYDRLPMRVYDPGSAAGRSRALHCMEALQELVRLKDIKERMDDVARHPMSMHGSREEFKRLREQYESGKDAAWEAARKALGE